MNESYCTPMTFTCRRNGSVRRVVVVAKNKALTVTLHLPTKVLSVLHLTSGRKDGRMTYTDSMIPETAQKLVVCIRMTGSGILLNPKSKSTLSVAYSA